jgi:hypothetical protein
MVQKVHVLLTCDDDGTEAEFTRRFSIDGTEYEVDLCGKHDEEFTAAQVRWTNVARATRKTARRGAGRRTPRAETASIRDWIRSPAGQHALNGRHVAERGRIPRDVVALYEANVA